MKPGVYDLSSDAYHADPGDTPTLSSSIARLLCTQSPAHARAAHPRLNPDFARQEEQHFDIGTAAHWLLLQADTADVVTIVEAKDWKTKAAQEQREAARAAGRLPLLVRHWDAVQAMVAAAREQLAEHAADPPLFVDGKAEQTLVWEDQGVVCRARLDWLHDDHSAIDDYKSTGRSADPDQWIRSSLFANGGDIQVAFYRRGLLALTGVDAEWRWVVQETTPPYALSVIAPGPDVLALGESKVEFALATWKRGMETGKWPAYVPRVHTAELPGWADVQWLERRDAA